MRQVYLGLAIHNHQPIGNFDWVFQEAYHKSYLPMLELLERHPRVRLSLHYTGPLVDWLRVNAPDFIPRVAALAARGQVELMSGGYYEPILPAIPDRDKLGQMDRMNRFLKEEMGCQPTGMWLAERVWEPHLPYWISQAGIQWTVLDDTHFKMVGLRDEDLLGYYITEEQGHTIKVFGTSKKLRYTIPWSPVDEVIAYLRSQAGAGHPIAVMGDDGEKFGMWPGTYRHCWEYGWMEQFFDALERNADWLQTIPLGEYAGRFESRGRVYLPTASYSEMMEWALPPRESHQFTQLVHRLEQEGGSDIVRFMRGGFWRYFMVKYPEVNAMHKKMLRVHRKVWQARDTTGAEAGVDDLWKAQCNCPYWHGVFGGIYMADIRAATYRHLVAAERAADEALHGPEPWVEAITTDFDCDGREEVLLESSRQNLYFTPAAGGALLEWDWRPASYNLLATMARRPEAYHQTLARTEAGRSHSESGDWGPGEGAGEEVKTIHEQVRAKERGLERYLFYDWYPRHSLLDHFLHPETRLEAFARSEYAEQGDFVDQAFQARVTDRVQEVTVELWRHGNVWQGEEQLPLQLHKSVTLQRGSDGLCVRYHLTNAGIRQLQTVFGTEWNLNLLGGGGNPQAYCRLDTSPPADGRLDESQEHQGVESLALGNRWLGLEARLRADRAFLLWRFPIESVSNSEAGFERVYQGTCLLVQWLLTLDPGQSWEVTLEWELGAPLDAL